MFDISNENGVIGRLVIININCFDILLLFITYCYQGKGFSNKDGDMLVSVKSCSFIV